jgi:GT2 family glycosyltransferase
MTLHAVAFLCKTPLAESKLSVTVVDGSPQADSDLEAGLRALGVCYLHAGRELSFAETYNTGIRARSSPVVFTLANDVLIEARQVRTLAEEIGPTVACAMPYLTSCDYGTQRQRRLPVPRRCFPTAMTLNANAFSRPALEKVGFLPEDMTGCFNDVVLFIRLREQGYSVVLRNVGPVLHLGRQTLRAGMTRVSYEADATLFSERYPRYWLDGRILWHRAGQKSLARLAHRVMNGLPRGVVHSIRGWEWVWWAEPYLCAERGSFREGLTRLLRLGRPSNTSKDTPPARP